MTNNVRIHLCNIRSFAIYRRSFYTVTQPVFGNVMAHSPAQIPVLLWTSAVYSHCSPLRVSQGFISEHTCPFWRAHTRQQAQSSRIRGTPGKHSGGSSGHWHLRGHTWDQANVNTCVGKKMNHCFICCWKSLFSFNQLMTTFFTTVIKWYIQNYSFKNKNPIFQICRIQKLVNICREV